MTMRKERKEGWEPLRRTCGVGILAALLLLFLVSPLKALDDGYESRSLGVVPGMECLADDGRLGGGGPPNGSCTGATVVSLPLGSSVTVSGNNENAPTDPIFVANLVWEAFTITACADVVVSYCGTSPAFEGGLVYLVTGCPITNQVFNSGSNIIPNVCGDGNFAVRFPMLPAGTYYYPVLEAPGSSGDYTLVFSATPCSATPPANALCAGAIALTSNATCVPVSGTVQNATAAGNTGTACGNGDISDGVWYSFVATGSSHEIVVTPSAEFNVHLSLFQNDCTAPNLLGCAIGQAFGATTTMAPTGLTSGATYYLRVADWYAGVPRTSTFDICVVAVAAAQCDAAAGSLTADDAEVCFVGSSTTISATPVGDAVVPPGFTTAFLLVSAVNEVVLATGAQPGFVVPSVAGYTIRTLVFDPATYDTASIALGSSTIGSLNEQFVQGGGAICASLDIVGAAFDVQNCCDANAGTLTAAQSTICFEQGSVPISAVTDAAPIIPDGSSIVYLLSVSTAGEIIGISSTPAFVVGSLGTYGIHSLVYDSLTFDLDQIVPGNTTTEVLNSMFIAGGGSVCGALDVEGAGVSVVLCCPGLLGSLALVDDSTCGVPGGATAEWSHTGFDIPPGHTIVYLLAQAGTGEIQDTTSSASIVVSDIGGYTIHALIHDTATLDLSVLLNEGTTIGGLDSLLVQGGGTICGLLDLQGALFSVLDCRPPNDECSAAQPVAVRLLEECNGDLIQGDNTYATQGLALAPTCGDPGSTYADVWYSLNTGDNTAISVVFDPGTATSWGIAIMDACDASVELACSVQPAAPIDVNTTPNTNLLVRIFSDLSVGQGGAFSFCVSGASPTSICQGGLVSTTDDAAALVVCQDANPDVVDLSTTSTAAVAYTYVVTDADSLIVALVAGNALDFNGLMLGTYYVHGVSHDGSLSGAGIGEPLENMTATGECLSTSSNAVEVVVEVCSGLNEEAGHGWSIAPNPNNGRFVLRSTGLVDAAHIQVFGADGRLLLNQASLLNEGAQLEFALPAEAAPGVYLVRVIAGQGAAIFRMVVDR